MRKMKKGGEKKKRVNEQSKKGKIKPGRKDERKKRRKIEKYEATKEEREEGRKEVKKLKLMPYILRRPSYIRCALPLFVGKTH